VAGEEDALRASDRDREIVAGQLREAAESGRLTMDEFDDRVANAYRAKTYGDLKALLADLPAVAPRPGNPLATIQPVTREVDMRAAAVSTAFWLLIMAIACVAIMTRIAGVR
jgi:hypothetical protein